MRASLQKQFLINMKFLLTIPQTLFVIIVPIILVIVIFVCVYIYRKNKHQKNNHREAYYKTIRNIAVAEDYYLINNFIFKIDGSKTAVIDHLLAGEKYFYIITSLYYDGNLSGNENDNSLILTTKESGKTYTDNPLFMTKTLLERLSNVTGLDMSLLIGVVLVNDSCQVNLIRERKRDGSEIPFEEQIYFVVNNNKLKSLIKKIESRNIENINAAQLDRAIKGLNKLNRRKK
jgi:hypothetical protein